MNRSYRDPSSNMSNPEAPPRHWLESAQSAHDRDGFWRREAVCGLVLVHCALCIASHVCRLPSCTRTDDSLSPANRSIPPLERALRRPNGLLAAGRDLSVGTLAEAYGQGIFPWFSDGEPILWWSPDPRMVLFPAELHVPKSLARRMKKDDYRVTRRHRVRSRSSAAARRRAPITGGPGSRAEMIARL